MGIGLGFAGAGWLGESLIRELPLFPELRLTAVQDVNGELASAVGQRHGASWRGERFEELLARADVDAVAISTPNAFHAEQAVAALGAGKHVLVQKPLALSAADAARVVETAKRAGRVLMVDYSYRYLATWDKLVSCCRGSGPSAAFAGCSTTSTARVRHGSSNGR